MNEVKKESAAKTKAPNGGFNKRHLWWQISALLAISFFSVYASGAFDDELAKLVPEKKVLVSTMNKRQSGLSGLLELTNKLGHAPKKWYFPYRQLQEYKGSLIVIAPLSSLKEYEIKQILKWVRAGNDLLYIDSFRLANSRRLPKILKLKIKTAVKSLEKEEVNVNRSINWLKNVSTVRVTSSSRLVGGVDLAGDKSGSVLLMVQHGKGRVIVGTSPRMFSNDLISDKKNWNNFQLAENIFDSAKKPVYFDERVHGVTGGKNVFLYLSRGPFGLVSLQLILITLLAFLSSAQRFGRAVKMSDARRISNLEFIEGLTNTYRRAKANASVLEILFHSFRVDVSKMLGISSHDKDEVLISAWANSPLVEDIDLRNIIEEYNQVQNEKSISDADLQNMIVTCDKITDSQKKGDLEIDRYAKSS